MLPEMCGDPITQVRRYGNVLILDVLHRLFDDFFHALAIDEEPVGVAKQCLR